MIVIHLSTQTSHSMASAKRKKIEHYTKSEYYIKWNFLHRQNKIPSQDNNSQESQFLPKFAKKKSSRKGLFQNEDFSFTIYKFDKSHSLFIGMYITN